MNRAKIINVHGFNLFLKPIIVALSVTVIWYFLYSFGILPQKVFDASVMSSGTTTVLGIFYALVAAFVLSTVWRQFISVEEAIKLRNKKEFIKHKDKRIPLPIKFLLVVFSLLLLGAFFVMHFESKINGIYSIFAITLGLTLNWSVIMDLDDPFSGVWNVDMPPSWRNLKGKIDHATCFETDEGD
jgi:hypothetical protein